ncbi:hypothetical protein Sm713_46500 [Streptomyces sp. TS71-3]|nr:hypothetical protein Sm713_46500 [Streptomyces sp. TS71-3]
MRVSAPGGGRRDVRPRHHARRGRAPARAYLPELLHDVLEGVMDPGPLFDHTVGLNGVPDGYRAMDDRSALKVRIVM